MSRAVKLIFVDLETTGANAAFDRITEIGIVEVDGQQVTRWSTLVNPQIPIPPFIQKLTGISNAMVADAPTFASLIGELQQRLAGGLFIAHNARFDYGFLRNEFKQAGARLRCDVLCTVKLSRKLFPHEARHNLDALMVRHQLVAEARHRALADADLLWQFWSRLQTEIAPQVFDDTVARLLQRPSLPAFLDEDALDDMPNTPGVYLFYDEHDLPLYIGKSVNLRQRIMAHFNSDHRLTRDMRLAQQIHRLEWRATAGEVGALLLEARLVKQHEPLHNARLRYQHELCSWQISAESGGHAQPVLVFANQRDFGRTQGLHGLFSSRRKAEDTLRQLAESHQLCLAVLGVEAGGKNKPCFAYQLQRCRGACVGDEPAGEHQARLEAAFASLQVSRWPYPGAISIVEHAADGKQEIQVIDNWSWLGTVATEEEAAALLAQTQAASRFDLDTYKILQGPITRGLLDIRSLHSLRNS